MAQRSWGTLPILAAVLAAVAGCERPSGGASAICGVATVAAATTLLEQFTIPNQTLAAPPVSLPERTVARVIGDGAFAAVVGRTDSLLVIGVEGTPPATAKPGFGVLVVDLQDRVVGVALYQGDPISGAPRLGEVSLAGSSIPLIGVQVDPAKITDPKCPSLFADSIPQ
jgi:hypothetical protein